MKVGIICAANIMSSPYVKYYTDVLDNLKVSYDVIIWNKMGIKESDYPVIISYDKCFDSTKSKIEKFIAYCGYSKFVIKNINENNYDKLILLTAQSGVLIYKYLEKHYLNNYILDIRDYANAKYYIKILKKLVKNSYSTSISSNGYLKWLPKSNKYIKSHNTSIDYIENYIDNINFGNKTIKISTIGQIRDYESNKSIIDIFKNNKSFTIEFIGKGVSSQDLKLYCDNNDIGNVVFKGQYKKDDEKYHYINSDFINLYIGDQSVSTGLLTNRLYNACIYGKPIITEKDSYVSSIVEKYNLGITINPKDPNILDQFIKFITNFDVDKFNKGRREFLEKVKIDIEKFEKSIELFINS